MIDLNTFLQVLSVEPDNKKLYLTRKKSLVDSTLRLFLSYDDALPGRVSHGYIVCVKDFGCIVRFYNNVKGLVPLRELSSEAIISPETVFYVGQVRSRRQAAHMEDLDFFLTCPLSEDGSVTPPTSIHIESETGFLQLG